MSGWDIDPSEIDAQRERRGDLSPRQQRSIQNRTEHAKKREKESVAKTVIGATTDDAREELIEAITNEIRSVLGEIPDAADITDGAIITSIRVTVRHLIKVALPSLLLLDGTKLVDAIERLTNVMLTLEGRATHITQDTTPMTQEQREQAMARVAELISKSRGE